MVSSLLHILCLTILFGTVYNMLDTSISCSDYECPDDKECFVPSCLGTSCRSVQPVCLTVVNVTGAAWKLEEGAEVDQEGGSGDDDDEGFLEFHLIDPSELRLNLVTAANV